MPTNTLKIIGRCLKPLLHLSQSSGKIFHAPEFEGGPSGGENDSVERGDQSEQADRNQHMKEQGVVARNVLERKRQRRI